MYFALFGASFTARLASEFAAMLIKMPQVVLKHKKICELCQIAVLPLFLRNISSPSANIPATLLPNYTAVKHNMTD
jgi:hypothetical protein